MKRGELLGAAGWGVVKRDARTLRKQLEYIT